jgi:hypothetical protein
MSQPSLSPGFPRITHTYLPIDYRSCRFVQYFREKKIESDTRQSSGCTPIEPRNPASRVDDPYPAIVELRAYDAQYRAPKVYSLRSLSEGRLFGGFCTTDALTSRGLFHAFCALMR